MQHKNGSLILGCIVFLASVFLAAQLSCATEDRKPHTPDVAGKKLIRAAQELRKQVAGPMADLEGKEAKVKFLQANVDAWQKMGLDGIVFTINSGQWWRVDPPLTDDDIRTHIEVFNSINMGRLTDNFFRATSSVWSRTRAASWFRDEDWEVVLANTRLAAKLAKETGFKGVVFDWEQYACHSHGAWRRAFWYKYYATEGYKLAGETAPRPFEEVVAKVRQRGRQYGEALSSEYPDITLFIIPGMYEDAWREIGYEQCDLEGIGPSLIPAFIDGLLLGLDERATLVSGTEKTYCDSRYSDMMAIRDQALNKGLVLSSVPELAKKRITFSVGLWTDAGWGPTRFSAMEVRANQRDPERHKHATHNALAASDKYAWYWGEMPWLTAEPTPLMRAYWRATEEARQPQDLDWEPKPRPDRTNYTAYNKGMAARDAAFWTKMKKDGWKVAMELPTDWHFKFDTDNQMRFNKPWVRDDIDESSWPLISSLKCWQSQHTPATGNAVYRIRFDTPADLDPATQDIRLAFGAYSPGRSNKETGLISWMDVFVNGKGYGMRKLVDVSESIKLGQSNYIGIRIINKDGPAGLMGHVKLLVRDSEREANLK